MMPDLTAPVLLAGTPVALVAGVYLWSADPDRRRRAWQLLRLLLRR
ncbi:hypothetical protein ABZ864_40965 [Streptomyces sp. NPDC047082]